MAAFITLSEVEIDLSSLTTRRLLDHDGDGAVDAANIAQRMQDACAHVIAMTRGHRATMPTAGEATDEEKRLARMWLAGKLAIDFPEYFRIDGFKYVVETDRQIANARNIEPAENKTHVASVLLEDEEVWT